MGWGYNSVAELPSMWEALGSLSSTAKQQINNPSPPKTKPKASLNQCNYHWIKKDHLNKYRKMLPPNPTFISDSNSQQSETRRKHLQPMRCLWNPVANTILGSERLNIFPWDQKQERDVCSLHTLYSTLF
jgi:hypothetical protein